LECIKISQPHFVESLSSKEVQSIPSAAPIAPLLTAKLPEPQTSSANSSSKRKLGFNFSLGKSETEKI